MKNKDILLDVIGDADEKLVPDITEEKKKSHLKWITLGGVCAAAAIGCAVFLPKGNAPLTPPAPSQVTTAPTAAQPDRDIYCLALAAYPDMPHYPEDGNDIAYKKWHEARMKLRDQPADYMNGFDTFFENSTKVFLTDAGSNNRVYSPLSLYMALGMSAEITDGTTRKQILDLLCQDDIQTLRSRANSIWEANYTDDGMARCVLASSLWLNDSYPCNMDTVRTTANNYYSSIYHGDPADERRAHDDHGGDDQEAVCPRQPTGHDGRERRGGDAQEDAEEGDILPEEFQLSVPPSGPGR